MNIQIYNAFSQVIRFNKTATNLIKSYIYKNDVILESNGKKPKDLLIELKKDIDVIRIEYNNYFNQDSSLDEFWRKLILILNKWLSNNNNNNNKEKEDYNCFVA